MYQRLARKKYIAILFLCSPDSHSAVLNPLNSPGIIRVLVCLGLPCQILSPSVMTAFIIQSLYINKKTKIIHVHDGFL